MGLVRCRTHNLMYNDLNPRGCPACDQQRKGRESETTLMRELARASTRETREAAAAAELAEGSGRTLEELLPEWARRFGLGTLAVAAAVILGTLVILAVWLSRPSFAELVDPLAVGDPLPFAITPGQPVEIVFSILGTQQPQPHPESDRVERYSYGAGLMIDAINGAVYSLEVGVSSRSWRGLRVGLPEREAEGTLALLANVQESGPIGQSQPEPVAGYLVFPSLELRPTKTLTAEVRPPNGCFDVVVMLQPRTIGVVVNGGERRAAVGREGGTINWAVSGFRVTSRSQLGPGGTRVC